MDAGETGYTSAMDFEAMLFDLDDTLYPPTSGVWEAIGVRIDRYIHERVHIPSEEVVALRKDLFHRFGTTLRGLVELYDVDAEDYLEYVHDIDLSRYLQPNDALRNTLSQYHQRKIIFTNASTKHARRVVSRLGLEGIFDQIVDIQSIQPYCKPQTAAFKRAFELAKIRTPEECIMLDDSLLNLHAAQELGMYAIQVGAEDRVGGVDAAIMTLVDLPSVVPVDGTDGRA